MDNESHSYFDVLKEINSHTKKKKNYNIYLLTNFNHSVLLNFIKYNIVKENLNFNIYGSKYDQVDQEIINKKKNKNLDKANILIIYLDFKKYYNLPDSKFKQFIKEIKSKISIWFKHFQNNDFNEILFFNFTQPTEKYQSSKKKYLKKINQYLMSFKLNNIKIFDLDNVVNNFGYRHLYDEKNYFIAKIPFSELAHNEIAKEVAKFIKNNYITRKKCLCIDLDNTLWGGVLGEDGVSGVKFGSNTYEGECFKNFSNYLKDISKKGVILAINSKNNIKDVREMFEKHPEMSLSLNDFSCIKINWKPKNDNLKEISKELNIGLDSIVFLDDSAYERENMKNFIPSVNILDFPPSADMLIKTIEDSGLFNTNSILKEDVKKRKQYLLLKKSQNLKQSSLSYVDLLTKLKMKLLISGINKINFKRCVQMTNKTNQFNLTSKRFSENSFAKFIKVNKVKTYVLSVKDKFGDHGVTGLAILKKIKGDNWEIALFLLSCRILGRQIEDEFLRIILIDSKKKNIRSLKGIFNKTKKNKICENFYIKNNFKKIGKNYITNPKLLKLKKTNIFETKII